MERRKKWKSRFLWLMQTESTTAHTEAFEHALFTENSDTTLEMNAQNSINYVEFLLKLFEYYDSHGQGMDIFMIRSGV